MKKIPHVAVVSYGAGNVRSMLNALSAIGTRPEFIEDPQRLMHMDALVVPGDGHFGSAMEALRQSGFARSLTDWIQADRPFLGVCVGMQVLYEESEESPGVPGLGILRGTVRRLNAPKVPHMGWNTVDTARPSRMLVGDSPMSAYFVHSFVVDPMEEELVVGMTTYGRAFPSVVERRALVATQFHPERSGDAGMQFLARYFHAV